MPKIESRINTRAPEFAQNALAMQAQIDKLERTKIEQNQFLRFDELYYIPLALGLLLVCLAFALRGTLLRRLP